MRKYIIPEKKQEKESSMYLKQDEVERRCLPTSELRIAEDSPKITGYAAVFNTWTNIGGWFRESIRPGAFAKTIREADVRALLNHNENYVLGRNRSGTLKLREDAKGLAIEINPVDSTWANDLMKSMRRGDVNQMSFGFTVNKEEIDPSKDERVLTDVTLFDVSVVTYPAYPTTSAQVRSLFHKATDTSGVPPPFEIVEPPELSELDRIVQKIKNKEELTEDELRAVTTYFPMLSMPPAKHTETPAEPPAKHSDGDISAGPKWMQLSRKYDGLYATPKPNGGIKA
jgi:HK97 family phage prohead protease